MTWCSGCWPPGSAAGGGGWPRRKVPSWCSRLRRPVCSGPASLARLADRYADDLPGIQQRGAVRVTAVVHAGVDHQARRLLPDFRLAADTPGRRRSPRTGPRTSPTPCPCCERRARTSTAWKPPCCWQLASPAPHGGKPLLTFRQIAAAIGAESEQAAQGRYRRKVGNLNNSDSGNDEPPDLQPELGRPQTVDAPSHL